MKRKRFLIIVATHGNEGFAVPVLQQLEKRFARSQYGYDWIIGNPTALMANKRFIDTDLNRCAPGDALSCIYEEKRAAEIMTLSKNYEFVIDIHGTNATCGVCTIIPIPRINNLLLAASMNCQQNIIWNNPASRLRGPLTQHVLCPAIELECGPKNNRETALKLTTTLSNFLRNYKRIGLGMNSLNWYQVIGLNSNKKTTSDFDQITHDNKEKFTFLNGEYASGKAIILEKICFDSLFYSRD